MYEIDAMVTRTGPTVLKLTADWPVDWLRASGIRTIEIQRELVHGEYLELPSVLTERADLDGDRVNWPKLWVGSRVVARCFFPGERAEHNGFFVTVSLGRTRGDGRCVQHLGDSRFDYSSPPVKLAKNKLASGQRHSPVGDLLELRGMDTFGRDWVPYGPANMAAAMIGVSRF